MHEMKSRDTAKRFDIRFILCLIIIIGAIVFNNALKNDFVWDDEFFIEKNTYIRSLKFIPAYFTKKEALAEGVLSGENYRPFLPFSYAIDYCFWKLNPFGYHLTNVVFHIINALLVFYLVLLITKDRFVGFFSSLIFLTHPVQTEAVAWASGRADVLFLFFFLFAFIMYIRHQESGHPIFLGISLFLFLCGLFSKEMTATLPFILILYDWIYGKKETLGARLIRYLPFFLILELFVMVRYVILGRLSQTGYFAGSFYATFLTMVKGVAYYIRLLFYPVGLCPDYLTFPQADSLKDFHVLLSFGVIIGFIALSIFLRKKLKHVTFGILLFFISLLPVMNIIPIKILIAERFLYLPIIGFALAIAVLLRFLYCSLRKKTFGLYAIPLLQALIIFLCASLTIAQNTVWTNTVTLYTRVVKIYPDNFRAHYNLALAHYNIEGDRESAFKELKKSFELKDKSLR